MWARSLVLSWKIELSPPINWIKHWSNSLFHLTNAQLTIVFLQQGCLIIMDHKALWEILTLSSHLFQVYSLPELNLESIFRTPPQTKEYDLPSLQQNFGCRWIGTMSHGSLISNDYFGEENSIVYTTLETIEEEDHLDNIYW